MQYEFQINTTNKNITERARGGFIKEAGPDLHLYDKTEHKEGRDKISHKGNFKLNNLIR